MCKEYEGLYVTLYLRIFVVVDLNRFRVAEADSVVLLYHSCSI